MGEQYPVVPRKLFAEGMPALRPEFTRLVEFPSAGVLPGQGSVQAPLASMPIVPQWSWLSGGQASETTGIIKKALEIADRAQDAISQSNDVTQIVQQNVQLNFKMEPPETSAVTQQRMQLEWEAIQLKQQKNELELAAYQQNAALSQRAVEVTNMETASRLQAIQKILHFEHEAQSYVQYYELEAEKQRNQSLAQENHVATMRNE
jgi:hypothetical protein